MEVKNNYAYVTTQRILNKFIESQIIIGINKNVICFRAFLNQPSNPLFLVRTPYLHYANHITAYMKVTYV